MTVNQQISPQTHMNIGEVCNLVLNKYGNYKVETEASDLAQEVSIKLQKEIDRGKLINKTTERGYIFRIATNCLISKHRKEKKITRVDFEIFKKKEGDEYKLPEHDITPKYEFSVGSLYLLMEEVMEMHIKEEIKLSNENVELLAAILEGITDKNEFAKRLNIRPYEVSRRKKSLKNAISKQTNVFSLYDRLYAKKMR